MGWESGELQEALRVASLMGETLSKQRIHTIELARKVLMGKVISVFGTKGKVINVASDSFYTMRIQFVMKKKNTPNEWSSSMRVCYPSDIQGVEEDA